MRYRFHEPTIDTNRPLSEGTIQIEGFDLRLVGAAEEADVWEAGTTSLAIAKSQGAEFLALPVFPNRKFRQSYIQVNTASGIESPRDLEGKTVGVRTWSNPGCTWARGSLQNYYKVDLSKVEWLTDKDDMVRELPGFEISLLPTRTGRPDEQLNEMLLSGEIDDAITPNVLACISNRDPRAHRLFRDYQAAEKQYFADTGIFPISHMVTCSPEFVDRHPTAAVAVLEAHRKARDLAFNRIEGSDPDVVTISWASALMQEQRELMGDNYWPYNVVDNHRSLDAGMEFVFQQGLTATKIDYHTLFATDAAALPGY